MFLSVTSLVLLPLLVTVAEACTCRLDPNPPCRAAGEADAVFEAEVLRRESVEPDDEPYSRRRFTMKVRKVYKGTLGRAVHVYTGIGDSDCGYRFKIGVRYLVYAYENEGRLSTGICDRTREIRHADLDRNYFNGLSTMPPGGSIFGQVIRNINRGGEWVREPFPEIKIEIEGNEKRTVATNTEGKFSVTGLSPGPYMVKAIMPREFQLSTGSRIDLFPYPWYEGKISDKGCIETYFVFEPRK